MADVAPTNVRGGWHGVSCDLSGTGVATGVKDIVTPLAGKSPEWVAIEYAEGGGVTSVVLAFVFRVAGSSKNHNLTAPDGNSYTLTLATPAAFPAIYPIASRDAGASIPVYAPWGGIDGIAVNVVTVNGTAAAGDELKVTFGGGNARGSGPGF